MLLIRKNREESMAARGIREVGDILKLADDKRRWDYIGRWVQPTLSMCTWPRYTKREAYKEIGLPETEADNIQLDGHYIEMKPNKTVTEGAAEKAAANHDETPFKKFVEVAEKVTKSHLELSSKLEDTRLPLSEALGRFFDSMDELTAPWVVSIYYGYALERAVSREMDKLGLKHVELAPHFELPRQTMLMRQEREAREFAEYLRDTGLMHLLDGKPEKIMDVLSNSHRDLAGRISGHLTEFEWVGTHHCWGEPLTMERLFTQIREAPPRKAEEKEWKKIPEELAWMIKWQNELAYWRQYCAETSDVGFYLTRGLLKEAARQVDLAYEEIIWLSDNEILEGLDGGGIPAKAEIREREKGFGYFEAEDDEMVVTGDRLRKLVEIHVPKVDTAVREFAGTVGSKGLAVGTAFVCATPQEAAAMVKGEILVVPQTTPDYVVVMKKAAAIVTDEGGITCHAAVVSRELGVPCVVGTRVATRVLKTGDRIEVDANSGTVKKL